MSSLYYCTHVFDGYDEVGVIRTARPLMIIGWADLVTCTEDWLIPCTGQTLPPPGLDIRDFDSHAVWSPSDTGSEFGD